MRRITVMLLAVLLGIGVANAQFRYGIKAGANFNKLDLTNIKNSYTSSNGTGWVLGVIGEVKIPILGFGLDASIMYARMNSHIAGVASPVASALGTRADDSLYTEDDDTDVYKTTSRNFIDIPINIKYKFLDLPAVGKWLSPMVYTGPDIALRIPTKNDAFKTFQFGWNLGVGAELFNHLQIGIGYTFGCNNVAKKVLDKAGLGISTDEEIKVSNSYWMLTAAYLF